MSCETPQPPERPSLSPALYALVTAILAERTLLGEGRLSCVFVAGGLSIMGVGALIWAWTRMGQIGRSARELTTCCVSSLLAAAVVTGALLVRGQSFVSAMEVAIGAAQGPLVGMALTDRFGSHLPMCSSEVTSSGASAVLCQTMRVHGAGRAGCRACGAP